MPLIKLELVAGRLEILEGRDYVDWLLSLRDEAVAKTNMGDTLFVNLPDGRMIATTSPEKLLVFAAKVV
jgi:hypothetical protein